MPAPVLEPTRDTVTPAAERHKPEVRRRLSPPAVRAFFNLADRWQLGPDEQRALLGWPSRSTLFEWKRGHVGALPYDTLTRLSLLLGIYKALHLLYPDDAFADEWVKMRNSNPLFANRRPLDLMVQGDVEGLYTVRRLLDGRRGGWH